MRTYWIVKTASVGLQVVHLHVEPFMFAHVGPFWTKKEALAVLAKWTK